MIGLLLGNQQQRRDLTRLTVQCYMTLMPRLTPSETMAFLSERERLVRIATVDPDGMPRIVPAWFIHADGQIVFTPRQASAWYENIRRDPRVCLSIDEERQPYRKLIIQGRGEILFEPGKDSLWRELFERICNRYFPPQITEQYLADFGDLPRPLIGIPLATSRVTSWRMPYGQESRTGIMARRYYPAGTNMARQSDAGTSAPAYFGTPTDESAASDTSPDSLL